MPVQVARANRLAVQLARTAKDGRIANLAMQLVSALHESSGGMQDLPGGYRMALARLRAALEDAEAKH